MPKHLLSDSRERLDECIMKLTTQSTFAGVLELQRLWREVREQQQRQERPIRRRRRRRRQVVPPPEAQALVSTLNFLPRLKAFEALSALSRGVFQEWLRLPFPKQQPLITRLSQRLKVPAHAIAVYLFFAGFLRLFTHERAEVYHFVHTWGPLSAAIECLDEESRQLAIWILLALGGADGWIFRIRRCQYRRCGQWFVDRSPTWHTNPARGCTRSHTEMTRRERSKPQR